MVKPIDSNDVNKQGKRPGIGAFALLHCSFFVYSFASVFAKSAAMSGLFTKWFFLFAIFEVCTLGVYALLWQQVLRSFTLVTAYANKGVVVIWNLLWAIIFFHERVTIENIIGGAIIIVGVVLVSSDADKV